jgi:hypothetical protein
MLWEVDETGSGLHQITGFVINGAESSTFTTR